MWCHARSEKGCVFVPMPALGTKKSTRAFVPKASESSPLVLRSGKRLVLSKPVGKKLEAGSCGDEWIRLFGRAVEEAGPRWWVPEDGRSSARKEGAFGNGGSARGTGAVRRSVAESEGVRLPVRRYGRAYNRKRKRYHGDDAGTSSSGFGDEDEEEGGFRYGVVYVRRKWREKHRFSGSKFAVADVSAGLLEEREVENGRSEIAECSRKFAERLGIGASEIWSGQGRLVALVTLVDPLVSDSLWLFGQFIVLILTRMRRKRVGLFNFMRVLLSKAVGGVFSRHGVHFLPVQFDNQNSFRNAMLHVGACRISSSVALVPLLTMNFAALPSYFKNMQMSLHLRLRFFYVPPVSNHLKELSATHSKSAMDSVVLSCKMEDMNGTKVSSISSPVANISAHLAASGKKAAIFQNSAVSDARMITDNGSNQHNMIATDGEVNVRELRSGSRIITTFRPKIKRNQRRTLSMSARQRPISSNANIRTSASQRLQTKPASNDVSLIRSTMDLGELTKPEDYCTPSQRGSDDRLKDIKSFLTEIKQKIDSISCKANILVIEADRCRREEGAEVMLESADSRAWYLLVKVKGAVRYLVKPQEVRSHVTNRYTNALMWSCESSWKLEFAEKMDWIIFKQLHKECSERNSIDANAIIIPVPGVRLVSNYDCYDTYVRPDEYIKTKSTEIERILASGIIHYDMDDGDEQWLRQLNSAPNQESGGATQLSEDNFEKIMYSFEKAAYNNKDGTFSEDAAGDICSDIANKGTVAVIFDYWSKKKKQKRAPLIKIFQEYPIHKMHAAQVSFLRKKRSFKRQASNLGRGKPAFYMQASAKQEQLQKIQEAEAAASKAEEVAVRLRSTAQMLMSNADLLTYKSVMALRLAEALLGSGSADIISIL